MFYLRTGTPGAGKTLSLIDDLRHIKDRPIYYHGIPELSPNLGWTLIDEPRDYHNHIPDGAIFILDECQKHFPVRAPKDKVPDAIAFIETHRHRGIDIYFITQHPSLLDHHARRLVGHHTHLQRNFGMPFAVKYTHNKLFDAANYHELQQCEKSQYRYPKDVYSLYKSAEVHTHKAKFPKKLLLLPVLLIFIVGGFYTVWTILHKHSAATGVTPIPTYSDHQAGQGAAPAKTEQIDWTTAFTPKIPGLPYTAPLYKDLAKPVALPIVSGCVASAKKCQCYTQQATKIDMPEELCRLNVKNSQFNPFRAKPEPEHYAARSDQNTERMNTSAYTPLPPPIFTTPDEHEPMYVDISSGQASHFE